MTAALAVGLAGLVDTGRHTVKPGETLGGIASRHGTSVSALAAANSLRDANHIVVGQVLVIPGGAGAGGGAPASHTVKPGEQLATIASRYGTTVSALVSANAIRDPNVIVIGTTLAIPTATGGGSAAPSGGHVVKSGESLASIAARYGISADALAAANGIVGDRIYAGTRLLLSSPGAYAPASSGPAGYTVRSGDHLSEIAARHGTTVAAIVDANGIANPNLVRIGAVLQVPGAGTGFLCPVPGASFFNDWGFPRGVTRWHAGNDLFARSGTPIVAPVAGTVSFSSGSVGGIQFALVTGDGTRLSGSHLSATGTSGAVAAGEVIGYVGDTGNALGGRPHLHFEIHPGGGAAVNPYPTLAGAC